MPPTLRTHVLAALLGAAILPVAGLSCPRPSCAVPIPRAFCQDPVFDVVVYGATSAGVVAAVTVARQGRTVVLVEAGIHPGGMSSEGLGATDIGNKKAIGGTAREFYRRIRRHYSENPNAWKWESREQFRGTGHDPADDAAWTFEPHAAELVFRQMLDEAGVPVRWSERLDLNGGVRKTGNRIESIRMESGLVLKARVFIDASFEGDLMALAGVSFHVGREANLVYGETLNGVQTAHAVKHQFTHPVDPWREPGNPASGTLPGVSADRPGPDGSGDQRVQAYCFRLCTTDVAENRIDWPKPAGYDPLRYELLLRNFEAGDHRVPWNPVRLPNRKTDSNNNFAVSTDYPGMNHDFPCGDWETRDRILAEHRDYQQGLMWTLANHPRVPPGVREHFRKWGLAADEFTDSGNWPRQFYVREARRMISELVMNENHCRGKLVVEDPVGLAAYTMDSHHVQRYVDSGGRARNEGDVQVGGFPPYPVAWRSIRPRESECSNLLVPVCLSASHIAWGSIRMEPVFMVLAESAGLAACLAIENETSVQNIEYDELRQRLHAAGQILEWNR